MNGVPKKRGLDTRERRKGGKILMLKKFRGERPKS